MKDDMHAVGARILTIRRSRGLTQADVAEKAGLSDRAYADIERGDVNMRVSTLMKVCAALDITPNDVLTEKTTSRFARKDELLQRFEDCSSAEKDTMLDLLSVYLTSLKE